MLFRLILLLCLLPALAQGQVNRFYHENAIFSEEIKSVMLSRKGFELSDPVLELQEDARLVLKFDDLSGEVKRYFYTILHCDADWNESFLHQNDYLEGFPDNPIEDFARSFNTTFSYINYYLELPNEQVQVQTFGQLHFAGLRGQRQGKAGSVTQVLHH